MGYFLQSKDYHINSKLSVSWNMGTYIQTLRTEIRHKRGSKTPVLEFAVILQLKSNVCCHLTRLFETSTLKEKIYISLNAFGMTVKRLEAATTTLTIQACTIKMFYTLT